MHRFAAIAVTLFLAAMTRAEPYPCRWFYHQTNFAAAANAEQAVRLVESASKAGLNGVILGDAKLSKLGVEGHDTPGGPYVRNVRYFLEACRRCGVEVIPMVGTISRAEGILAHDPNLAVGFEVRDALFEVRGRSTVLVPDPPVRIANAGFEEAAGDRPAEWVMKDSPGRATVWDRATFRSGSRSIRLEPASPSPGSARLSQVVRVHPYRCYRVGVWVRTDDLDPPRAVNIVVMDARRRPARYLTFNTFPEKRARPWALVETVFNSKDCEEVEIVVGLFGARSGVAWIDDVEINEVGLVNVLRRPGCPLTVRSEDGKTTYQEGKDFDRVEDPLLGRAKGWPGSYDRYHAPAALRMRNGLPEGARLRVSFYHPLIVHEHQVDCCMVEPGADAAFERIVRGVDGLLGGPRRWLLNYDELRTGGSCAACRATGRTPGQLLADNFRRFAAIVRKARPGAELLVWHDMFDPNANAVDEYYHVQGTLKGSWEGLDQDVIVLPWIFDVREKSMRFFADRGHRQIVSACFDSIPAPDRRLEGWLQTMNATPGVLGIVYVTWNGKYEYLPTFGRVVAAQERPAPPAKGR